MKTVLLDGMIYDALEPDIPTRTRIRGLIRSEVLRVIATPKVRDELEESPFRCIPAWFPVCLEPEAVFILGHGHLDQAALGEGDVFEQHRGKSEKVSDAIVADSADSLADILVSEDKRCRDRLKRISKRCIGMTYQEFIAWLKTHDETSTDKSDWHS